jgi:drug/metabolite transporter (DMT)-like permease
MKLINLNTKPLHWTILLLLSFIWGVSFILIKRGLESFTDIQVGSIRICSASIFMIPFFFKKFKHLKRKHIFPLLITGFLGNLIPAVLFAKAQTSISSATAGILNAIFPIIALFIGFLFFKDKPASDKTLGIIIGLIGTTGIVLSRSDSNPESLNYYALYIVLAVILYGISINTVKHKLKDLDGFTISVFTFSFIAPFSSFFLIYSDVSFSGLTHNEIRNLAYIVILGVFSSAIAVSLYYTLTDYTDVAFSSLSTYIIPCFALFWGLTDGERISAQQIIFLFIILLGVFFVNRKSKKTPANDYGRNEKLS